MNMHQWLLTLAALCLFAAGCFFLLLLGAGGRMDPGLLYLLLSMAGGVCACFFAGLSFLRKAYVSSSPTRVLWGIAGGAALIPVALALSTLLLNR